MTDTALSASLEDYLEAIYHIVREKQAARPKDIAQRLEVGNSSVTGALKALAARNLVNYAPYDIVTLTTRGQKAARAIVHCHESLREFFVKVLAADPKLAERAACEIEHVVPAELLDRLVHFVEFIEMCPHAAPGLLEGFRVHLEKGCRPTCFDECPVESPLPVFQDGSGAGSEITTIADLVSGQTGKISRVQGDGPLRRRLMDLGLIAGTEVTLERAAPLGDPLEILVKGSHLSLRRDEANAVHVERIE